MKDMVHAALKFMSYYRWTVIALTVTALMVGGAALTGCRPLMVSSPLHEGQEVSEDQLAQEFATLQQMVRAKMTEAEKAQADALAYAEAAQIRLDASQDELERKRLQREQAWAAVSQTVTTVSSLAPPPVGTIVAGLLGLGSVLLNVGLAADSRRKDKLFLSLKAASAGTST